MSGLGRVIPGVWRRRTAAAILSICAALLSGCSGKTSFWGDSSTSSYGPRIVELGQPIPKGGGRYKLGSPYTINGKTYTPQEVGHYDRSGIASWYGKDFHGRRTANGEIYDMEALTAAHTTLPLPCYVQVTNPANGRSLVLRVNDRGPYVDNREIDLSWAAASLLQIEKAGTGYVRVEYRGPAPIDGNDRQERQYLARQSWAGPRVAQAPSPAKALRQYESGGWQISARETPAPVRLAANTPATAPARVTANTAGAAASPKTAASAWAPKRAPAKSASPLAVNVASAAPQSPVTAPKSLAAPVPARKPSTPSAPAPAAAPPKPEQYYVVAGTFAERATADKLAAILTEIAPTSIELTTSGSQIVHRLRLGPFEENAAATSLIARIRNAGLTDARLLTTGGI